MSASFNVSKADLEKLFKESKKQVDKAVFDTLEDTAYFVLDLIQHGGSPLPQRDTGYMQGAYSFHIGTKFSKESSGSSDKKIIKLPPDLDGISKNELRISFEAPYAAAQQLGYRVKNGKKILLNPKQSGTGPGWLDKLEPRSGEIIAFIQVRFSDKMGMEI